MSWFSPPLRAVLALTLLPWGAFANDQCERALRPVGLPAEALTSHDVGLSLFSHSANQFRFVSQMLEHLPASSRVLLLAGASTEIFKFITDLHETHGLDFLSERFRLQTIAMGPEMKNGHTEWTRDYFPELVYGTDGQPVLVSFRYKSDGPQGREGFGNLVAESVAATLGYPLERSSLVAQGGNLESDGSGNLFVTTRIIEDNGTLSREEIEAELLRALRMKRIHWLPPLPRETTGHIDTFAKFVGNRTFIVSSSMQPDRQVVLNRVAQDLKDEGFRVVRILNAEGAKATGPLTLSYTNSLIVGNTVFMPTYGGTNDFDLHRFESAEHFDRLAAASYRALGYAVQTMPMEEHICRGGAVHCLTHQFSF